MFLETVIGQFLQEKLESEIIFLTLVNSLMCLHLLSACSENTPNVIKSDWCLASQCKLHCTQLILNEMLLSYSAFGSFHECPEF